MKTTITERIRQIIAYLGVTERKFAETATIPQSTFSSYFNRGSEPSLNAIVLILKTYPWINAKWLLLEEGEMVVEEKEDQTNELLLNKVVELSGKCALLEDKLRCYEKERHINMAAEKKPKYGK